MNKDLESIEASEIKQIEHTGTTGGKDGNYSYSFSDDEVIEFINLLNQVKLGDEVDEKKLGQYEELFGKGWKEIDFETVSNVAVHEIQQIIQQIILFMR